MTKQLALAEIKELALNATIMEFEKLPAEIQADVILMTKLISDKFGQFYKERRKSLERILPDDGFDYDRFTIKWQKSRGSWLLDEEKLMETHPEKVIKTPHIDPQFAEDYLAKVKEKYAKDRDYKLPPEVMKVEGEGRTMVIREKKAKEND